MTVAVQGFVKMYSTSGEVGGDITLEMGAVTATNICGMYLELAIK